MRNYSSSQTHSLQSDRPITRRTPNLGAQRETEKEEEEKKKNEKKLIEPQVELQ